MNCVISSNVAWSQAATFAITDKNLYVRIVTWSTQDNSKLIKQWKSGFKHILSEINSNQKQ